jgi:unsaturated chondroitin disaccharide hydrolase
MKIRVLAFFTLLSFLFTASHAQMSTLLADKKLQEQFKQNFKDAAYQYKVLMRNLPDAKFPKTYFPESAKYEFSNSSWWCSGFYPGSLLLMYEQTKDAVLYKEAERSLDLLRKEQYNKGTHDLGFMMYCSFGNANRLKASDDYKQVLWNSAKSLATRFNPNTGCIRSWNSKPGDFLVIIDNMMNLKLLFWATQISGDSSFYKIAVTHANTTMKNHFRSDYSSYHVLNYDSATGVVKQKRTAQGFADSSAWARGQAWGLYGFTEAYRETKDTLYLQQANKIAQFLLSHPNMPANKIPYWDFDAPKTPATPRDASAASIMASALLELSAYVQDSTGKQYLTAAETMLRNLTSPEYRATDGANGGFIIRHGVGHLPANSEIDVPLTYGDYYYLEAMKRYLLLKAPKK